MRSNLQSSPAHSDGRRSLRKDVQLEARVRVRGTPMKLNIIDLSAIGFRAESVYNLPIGSPAYVTLPGLGPIEAKVAWRDAEFVGCAFTNPLHPAIFEHIAKLGG